MNGTSWLLGGGYPWYSGDRAAEVSAAGRLAVVANRNEGLSLAALPNGPLGLESPDSSLGRLTLPRGVAIDGATVLRLSGDASRILRYDAVRQAYTPLPEIGSEGIGTGAGDDVFAQPRRFRRAANIVAYRGLLYVADPEARRVQVFDLATLALIRLHLGLVDPVDVAAGRSGAYILDRGTGRVYRGIPFSDDLAVVVDGGAHTGWNRIAVDSAGERGAGDAFVYVYDAAAAPPALLAFTLSTPPPAAAPSARFTNSTDVRDRFGVSEVFVDADGALILPDRLADPCRLRNPREAYQRAWTVAGRVYVIDTRARTVTVQLTDGRVRHRFRAVDAFGLEVSADAAGSWAPVDLVELEGCVYILDERHQTVYAHRPGSERLQKRFSAPADHELRWRRIGHDGRGCLLLWDGVAACADRVTLRGEVEQQVKARPHWPPASASSEATGSAAKREAPPRDPIQPTFARAAVWTSRWLDSDIYNCQWHALEMKVSLPAGSRIVVRTRTSNERESDAEVAANASSVGTLGSWRDAATLVGASQPDESERKPRHVDVLVQSGPGQHLQLRLELSGDSIRTPVVHQIRVRFPRESLLQYLPAIYSRPEEQREFLERYLSIAQATWSSIEREVETFERYLDPDSVPPHAMAYLAGWLDLRLEGTWDAKQNRRLLQAMPKLRDKWGTREGMVTWLRVYLANIGGVDVADLEAANIPGIVENFVERRRLMLNRADAAGLGAAEGLWSTSVERRFQVGVFDREGDVELVSDRHPETDLFRHYAHAFRVFVPAGWVRTADDEALIRRAIELQKPAHTTYELVLVEPRFRIGEQSTLDLDSVIGAPLPALLACAAQDIAPARPSSHRLGYDTTLGCAADDGGM